MSRIWSLDLTEVISQNIIMQIPYKLRLIVSEFYLLETFHDIILPIPSESFLFGGWGL